jgi:hypothetical protein
VPLRYSLEASQSVKARALPAAAESVSLGISGGWVTTMKILLGYSSIRSRMER